MEDFIKNVFPNISDEKLSNVINCFEDIGIYEYNDLKYLTKSSLKNCNFTDFEKRKLIGKIKTEFKLDDVDEKRETELYLKKLENQTEAIRCEIERLKLSSLEKQNSNILHIIKTNELKTDMTFYDSELQLKLKHQRDIQNAKTTLEDQILENKKKLINVVREIEIINNKDPKYVPPNADDYYKYLMSKEGNKIKFIKELKKGIKNKIKNFKKNNCDNKLEMLSTQFETLTNELDNLEKKLADLNEKNNDDDDATLNTCALDPFSIMS